MIYLASPYTKFAQGHTAAYEHARHAAAWLMKRGTFNVFSPITYGHTLCEAIDLGNDALFWHRVLTPYMDAAWACIVLTIPGWHESDGIARELAAFASSNKPVWELRPQRRNPPYRLLYAAPRAPQGQQP